MSEHLTGADYVAVKRLTDKPGNVLAAVGERCDRVPAASLGWLEAKGAIQRIPREEPAPAAEAKRAKGKG